MNKKIDFFNKDNKTDFNKSINNNMFNNKAKTTSGSKTSKPLKKIKAVKSVKITKKSIQSAQSMQPNSENVKIQSKRRGRRPKKILETIDADIDNDIDQKQSIKNNPSVILRLNIDPAKLKNKNSDKNKLSKSSKSSKSLKQSNVSKKQKKITNNLDLDDSESSENEIEPKIKTETEIDSETDINENSSEEMFKNDIPCDNTCNKCSKNEKLINLLKSKLEKYENKEKIDKASKIYCNKLNFISWTKGGKVIIKKTNSKCRWDGHQFTNLPCFLVELYHKENYYIRGCFCSFNCALAYNLYYLRDSKIYTRKSLTFQLYREMHGLSADADIDIKEAPREPHELLEGYDGEMTIETFRRTFTMLYKEYILYMPPIKTFVPIIEERNIQSGDDTDKEYVLKRTKPLSKKKSIISTMKINMDDDD